VAKLPVVTGRDFGRFLERQGFRLVRIRGSHHYYERNHLRTSVPCHGNRPLKRGTFHGLLRDINMTREEFLELWPQ
jgi:predicted RNA binding protein YcfA (HicA-like mRNA interferase family)